MYSYTRLINEELLISGELLWPELYSRYRQSWHYNPSPADLKETLGPPLSIVPAVLGWPSITLYR